MVETRRAQRSVDGLCCAETPAWETAAYVSITAHVLPLTTRIQYHTISMATPEPSQWAIQTSHLTYCHKPNTPPSLRDINLALPHGSRTILIGANGGMQSPLFISRLESARHSRQIHSPPTPRWQAARHYRRGRDRGQGPGCLPQYPRRRHFPWNRVVRIIPNEIQRHTSIDMGHTGQ